MDDRGSGADKAVLAVLDHEALACRNVAITYAHFVEHLAVRLPAVWCDHMPDITALVVEELDVWVLRQQRLERSVGLEAVASGSDRRGHELDAKGRRAWIVEVLFEFPGP